MSNVLHHAHVRPEADSADRAAFVLHGILGSGANLRPIAQAFVKADARQLAVLVDLRQHGR
jgi:esterase